MSLKLSRKKTERTVKKTKSDKIKEYLINDNGGKPFKVVIKNINDVYVFKRMESDNDELKYSDNPILTFKNVAEIFIGKSPKNKMTEFSRGYGPKFDGNTILLHIQDLYYVCISYIIFQFKAQTLIKSYNSPVGNSDVAYPFAIDTNNNYYLLAEPESPLILTKPPTKQAELEEYKYYPYGYYYRINSLNDPNNKEIQLKVFNTPIKSYLINQNDYILSYTPNPDADYDRISGWEDFGKGMRIVLENGKEIKLDKAKYKEVMYKMGGYLGFVPITDTKILQERLD